MAFRNQNRRNDRNFDHGNGNGYGGGGGMNRNVNPWGGDNGGNNANYRQGGGGGGGGGMNNDVISLANSLVNNLLRNQNNQPPSLLDLPNNNMRFGGGGGGGGRDNNFGQYNNRQMGNRNFGNNRNMRAGAGGPRNKLGINLNKGGGIRKRNANDRNKKNMVKPTTTSSATASKDSKQQITDTTPTCTSADTNDNSKTTVESGAGPETNTIVQQESVYSSVPNDMFYCHLCKKHMWDATSFQNHIKGRTHMMMKEGVEESYRLKANMIRQEGKIDEQLKCIELDRLKRIGKKNVKASHLRREYCTMCDLRFYGHLSAHRRTEGHLNLKRFLHPKCNECNMEFPTRIDYDGHLLSPEHMVRSFDSKATRPEKRKNQLNILSEEDEMKDLKEEKEPKPKAKSEPAEDADGAEVKAEGTAEANGETANAEGTENANGGEEGEGEAGAAAEPVVEPNPEPEDIILDYVEGDVIPNEVEAKIPRYNCNRKVAAGMIHKLECWECQLCGRFFDSEKTSEIHARTVTHHRNFVKFLNEKSNDTKIAEKRAAAAFEESERKKRKLNNEEPEAQPPTNGTAPVANVNNSASELYDPTEVTEDDELLEDKSGLDVTLASTANDQSLNETVENEEALLSDEPIEGTVTAIDTPAPVCNPQPVTPQSQPQLRQNVQKTPQSNQSTPNQRKQNGRGGRGGYRGRGRNKNRY